ncbi:flagellar hook-associated protein FlgL [Lysinibacillus halotolerans]|uniref:Flagellar hook-associated protein FlgL n=1 Tax=Lysinibacillus halotolerans TaxID=1368476 RepID=A0A3M8HDZ0_9BACI|nr:flagellar hook-associated protein FlgL [Lysinibacillus halotolerans]RND00674.1 flagellar hook-associated protein FlgL [Lysinibacillus halotolerans]
MRVTQSMLSNNMLRNLSTSYSKMSELQNQINTGSKITRPSDDPVIAIKGMSYRTDLNKVSQFERNMNEVNSWLDSSDDALGQVGDALNRVKELVVQAANDTNTADDRQKIKLEIDQIRSQIQDVANTKIADKYIFNGTKTQSPLFVNGELNPETYDSSTGEFISATSGEVNMEVFDGIQIQVNTSNGAELFKNVDDLMANISSALDASDGEEIGNLLGGLADGTDDTLSELQNKVLEARADVGARQNRVEMMTNRLSLQEINVTKQMSQNEDVDYAEAITQMITYESIHQASLSVGAKIIQQTLVNFL